MMKIYSLKIQLLFEGNEAVIKLTARELQAIKRFNHFVVSVYMQSWFTSRITADAPINDVLLIRRLRDYDDETLHTTGLNMMRRHSWYLSQELATLALFSNLLSQDEKAQLVQTIKSERGAHLLTSLPRSVKEISISRTFFQTTRIDDSFLDVPVNMWEENQSFKAATDKIKNFACVND